MEGMGKEEDQHRKLPLQVCLIYLDAFPVQCVCPQLYPYRAKSSDVPASECARLIDIVYK